MMKKISFLMVAIFLMNYLFGQENGIVSYTVTHNWIKKYAACNYISKAEKERMAYVWGNDDDNEWVKKAELKFNANAYKYEYKEDENSEKWRRNDYAIYRDRENGETCDVLTLLNKDYVIKDSITCQNWKIKNDMKEVAGRICMNASYFDSIKEKEVMAWFALDLPVSIGPDMYCGLPGIILEVNEANGAVVYTATNLLLFDEKVEIAKPIVKKKRKTIDYHVYNNILSKYISDCKKMQRPYFW